LPQNDERIAKLEERAAAVKDRVRAGHRRRGEWWKLIAAITAAAAVAAPYLDKWL
jgi:hypothetical protein